MLLGLSIFMRIRGIIPKLLKISVGNNEKFMLIFLLPFKACMDFYVFLKQSAVISLRNWFQYWGLLINI